MIVHKCDKCGKELCHGRDLVNGELEIEFPQIGERSAFILRLQAVSCGSLRPTERDLCRRDLIKYMEG